MTDQEKLSHIAYIINLYLKSKTNDTADDVVLKVNDIVYA